jgi:autotransporter-associated beta strand protein
MKAQRLFHHRPPSRFLASGIATLAGIITFSACQSYGQAISLSGSTVYSQNFDSIGVSDVFWSNNTTLPGWYAGINAGATATGNLQASNGVTDFSGLLNLGAAGAGDRAIGTKVTGTNNFANAAYGVLFQNTTASPIRVTSISYAGELWRTNTTAAGLAEVWSTYYKVSPTLFTDVESGGNSATPNQGSFTAITPLNWSSPNNLPAGSALDGNLGVNRAVKSIANAGVTIAPGSYFMLRWVDTNLGGTDGHQGIDDLSINFASYHVLTYNLAHSVGGAPNGTLEVSASQYWLESGTPRGFQAFDEAHFSQDGTATIAVPVDVNAGLLSVEANTGTYTIGGPGKISGSFSKSGGGSLILTSPNSFLGTATISAGNVESRANGAFGSSDVALSGFALLRTTTVAQTQTGNLSVDTGGGTVQTDTDLTFSGGLNGISQLTKTGNGVLTLNGVGNSTGPITVTAGKLSVAAPTSLGGNGQTDVTLSNNATLEFTGNAAVTFNDATIIRNLNVGPGGATISVPNGAVGNPIIFSKVGGIIGSSPITKIGNGTIRITTAQTGFSGNWIVNGGALELNIDPNGFGTGSITVNPGGNLVVQGNPAVTINNSVILNGGILATRSGDNAVYGGPVNVAVNSFASMQSHTTPANAQNITVSGILSGSARLTLTGSNPILPIGAVDNLKGLILTNLGNTFSGTYEVTSFQNLYAQSATGTGNPLGTGTVLLEGGKLMVRDNGLLDNSDILFGGNIATGAPTDATYPGVSTVSVDRQVTGVFTGNTIALGTLTMGNHTLAVIGGNGYKASFSGGTFNGEASIQTDGITVPTLLGTYTGAGSLNKTGVGGLFFGGTANYTGPTKVSTGTLSLTPTAVLGTTSRVDVQPGGIFDVTGVPGFVLPAAVPISGTGTVAGVLTVANGGKIEPGDAFGAGTLTMGNLTFGSALGHIGNINFVLDPAPGQLAVTTLDGLILNGGGNSVNINIGGPSASIGTYTLVDYSGTIGGAGFTGFKLNTLPSRVNATLVNNLANTSIDLNVTGVDFPIWSGALSSEWSTATLSNPKNWVLNSNNTLKTDFVNNDKVVFDDFAGFGAGIVTINVANVSVSEVLFNNTINNYTINGTKAITGVGVLTKNGSGLTTINTLNTFTGVVSINGGTLRVPVLADTGVASSLGAGSAIVFGGGTLEYTGAAPGASNRPITINIGGGTVSTSTSVTLSGTITGTGTLTKAGTGTLVLTGANTYGTTTIVSGKVNVGGGGASGTFGIGDVTNDGTIILDHTDNVAVNNGISGSGGVEKRNTNTTTLGGTAPNTYSGPTTVFAGTLIAGKQPGFNAIGGDLILEAGGTFRYLGNNSTNQIADTSNIVLNGGTFGDPLNVTPTNPGSYDVVGSLTVNSGNFGSGRTVSPNAFQIAGQLAISGGAVYVQRAGIVNANSVLMSGGDLNLDGGSTTAAQESKLTVGPGGMVYTGGNINFNSGPSPITATSVGSVLELQGDFTSTGTHTIKRLDTGAIPALKANVDLTGLNRAFNITGSLSIGSPTAPIIVTNGALTKSGPGTLILSGNNNYTGATTIESGTLAVNGVLSGTSGVEVKAGAFLDVTSSGMSFTAVQTLTGGGTIQGSASTTGVLAPGPGVATLTFTSTLTLAGTAEFEIQKLGLVRTSDLASVTGTLTLGGTLNVTALGDTIQDGDVFNLFDAGTFSGNFGTVNLPALTGGLFWDSSKLSIDGTIVAVPEPTGAVLLLAGLGALVARRRRR